MRPQADDAAFMAYAPLVQMLLDRGRCQFCYDYDVESKPEPEGEGGHSQRLQADLVMSIDKLGELEPSIVDACLDEMASMTRRLVLLVVRRTSANAAAGDPLRWLLPKVGHRFDLIHFQDSRDGFLVLACPNGQYGKLDAEIDLPAMARDTAWLTPHREAALRAAARRLAHRAEAVRRNAGALWLGLRDGRTPWYAKAIAVVACVLAVSPLDFTPDVVPRIGFLDDLAILALGTILAAHLVSPGVVAELRERAASIDYERAVRGSRALVSIWLIAGLVAVFHAWRPVV